MADTAASPAARPEKPDEEKFKKEVAEAEKVWKAAQEKLNAVKAKLDLAKPRDKDSPTAKRQQELRAELSSIRQQQSGFKNSRSSTHDKIVSLDTQLKNRINEQNASRAKVPYKSVQEIDDKISKLDKDVESGTMKLVDEKKALAEITSLKKLRKNFAGFADAQKGIDDVKSQIAELKKGMDNPEAKALSERYTAISKELDAIRAEQDEAFKSINSLRDDRTKYQEEQQAKYAAMKEIKDKYHQGRNAYRAYEQELYKAKQERRKAENEAYAREKRMKVASARLEEASRPAFTDEIMTAEGLINYFDPSTISEPKALRGPSGFAASAQRTVDDSAMKGTVLSKKEDRDDTYFMGGGKKGKKGKKGPAGATGGNTAGEGKLNLSMGIIEELAKVNVDPPSSNAELPSIIEKLQAKVAKWKEQQDAKTAENIAKAKAEIEKLEADAEANGEGGSVNKAQKPSDKMVGVNGKVSAESELAQEEDAAKDVAKELEETKLEDAAQ